MLALYARTWWAMALRGLFSIIFGVLALIWPQIAVEALVLLFAAFVLVDGVFALISAIDGRKEHRHWWLLLLEGVAGIAFAVVAIGWPRMTAVVLLLLIAGWAIATGILQIVTAILLRKELRGEWLLVAGFKRDSFAGFGGVAGDPAPGGRHRVGLADRRVRNSDRCAADRPGLSPAWLVQTVSERAGVARFALPDG